MSSILYGHYIVARIIIIIIITIDAVVHEVEMRCFIFLVSTKETDGMRKL